VILIGAAAFLSAVAFCDVECYRRYCPEDLTTQIEFLPRNLLDRLIGHVAA
jgi:hypothetical protein